MSNPINSSQGCSPSVGEAGQVGRGLGAHWGFLFAWARWLIDRGMASTNAW